MALGERKTERRGRKWSGSEVVGSGREVTFLYFVDSSPGLEGFVRRRLASASRLPGYTDAAERGTSKTNYAANFGPDRAWDLAQFTGSPQLRGVFSGCAEWGAAIRDIPDGTSNTVAFAEIISSTHEEDGRGCWIGGVKNWFAGFNRDAWWIAPRTPNDRYRDRVEYLPPGVTQDPLGLKDWQGPRDSQTTRSRHVGGVHVLFCDGSAAFVSENIDAKVWISALSSQGGEASSHASSQ